MKAAYKAAFTIEMDAYRAAEAGGDLDRAMTHLERAHIIGQRYFVTHMRTHLAMLRLARRRNDAREMRGQLARIAAVLPGYLFGWIPKGNTGGANVSAMKPMAAPTDLAPLLRDYSVAKDMAARLLLWTLAALAIVAASNAGLNG